MATNPAAEPPHREPAVAVRGLRWWICGLLFLGSAINYIDRGTIAILAPKLQELFQWSQVDYGRIVGAFMIAYAASMPFWGGVIDRLGTRAGYAVSMGW